MKNNWQEVKFKDILKIGSGKDYKHLNQGSIPVYGTGGFMLSVDEYLYNGETVFIGRKGTIDKPFYYKGKFWTVDTLFYTYDFKNTSAKFVYLLFQKINWKKYNEASGVPSLSKTTIENIKMDLPPIEEQGRIVRVLECWDGYLEKLGRKIEVKKNIKKALMQKLLTGDKRLVGFSDKWQAVKLGDVCKIERGDMITKNDITHGNIPVIAGGKQPAYYHNKYNYDGKTITVSGSGASAGYINYFNQKIFASDCSVVKGVEDSGDIDFIYFSMEHKQDYIFSLQSGGAQPHVYPKDLLLIKIKIPKLEEQKAIAEILTKADDEISALEKKKEIVLAQKKYLLNNLVTGNILTPEKF